ncbi:MAG: S8 family serine peptidase, partial [Bdellovibrionota bacterium]
MTNIQVRTLTLGTLLVGALSMNAFAEVVSNPNRVLVIDEGVDLQHSDLSTHAFVNAAEQNGQKTIDDDRNGFVDDVSGWNAISHDSEYFPAWVRKMFVDNSDTVTKLFALYNRIEEGDKTALETVRTNPDIASALNTILGLSHGTHVSGIVVRYGNPNAELASLNVFTSSQEPAKGAEGSGPTGPTFAQARLGVTSSMARFKSLVKETLSPVAETAVETPNASQFVSQFDDSAGITDFLTKLRAQETAEKSTLAAYVRAVKPRVANLSLGSAKIGIQQALDSMWEEDLTNAKLPLTTQRTALQERNYQRMLADTFEIFRGSWNQLFRANPNTLFVIAAGNDGGDATVPNSGNNGINEVLPANCSKDNANVITIAATTQEGVIADFSNFNATLVNVGAWGTQVPSIAPNNNTAVKMSGTSMASPNAAGLASRIISVNARLTAAQTRQILEGTVKKVASLQGKVSSNGMVDPQAALDAASRTLLSNNVAAAITEAVQARNNAVRMPSILSTSPFAKAD